MRILVVLIMLYISSNVFAVEDTVKSIHWGKNFQGRFKKDSRLPLYTVTLYFADGALSDPASKAGLTQVMFDLLGSGTSKLSKTQIDDRLDFWSVKMGASVSHEFSTLSYSGLVEHIIPTTKLLCHLLSDAKYPEKELDQYKVRETSDLNNIQIRPQALAEKVFRAQLFKGTPYASPATPTLDSLKNIRSEDLKGQLQYFRKEVKKAIYVAGPSDSLKIRDVLLKECAFNFETSTIVKKAKMTGNLKKTKAIIYLVPLDILNQAQIRIGRFMGPNELSNPYLMSLVSEFLGGGFTSLLNYELRTKRALVYGSASYVSLQRDYGRLGVVTSTRVESVPEALISIQNVLKNLGKGTFEDADLKRFVDYLSGSYLFGFENNDSFLSQLVFFDHVGRDYHELYRFPEIVKGFTKEQVVSEGDLLFNPKKQTIVILGPRKLEKELKKIAKVEILNYKNFL